jgi:hypothetical protein
MTGGIKKLIVRKVFRTQGTNARSGDHGMLGRR